MSQPFVYPVPLLTSQVLGAHPFFIGEAGQTENTENLWVDERQNVYRRPAVVQVGDFVRIHGNTVGLYEYQYKARGSAPARYLVGYHEVSGGGLTAGTGGAAGYPNAGAFVLNEWTITPRGRLLLRSVGAVYSGSDLDPGDVVLIYDNSTTSSDGNLFAVGVVVADNVDFGAADGSLVVKLTSGSNTTAPSGNVRVASATSTSNVQFTESYLSSGKQTVWAEPAESYMPDKIPTFAQFGRLLFVADDSGKSHIRVWGGGSAGAQYLRGSPRGSIVFVHQGRLCIAGLVDDGSVLALSAIGQPTNFQMDRGLPADAMALGIEQDDREAISGAASSYRGDLFVWKKRSLHRIAGDIRNPEGGPLSFRAQTVTRSIGCASHRSIAHVGNDIYWMSEHGVHSLEATDRYGDVETAYLSFSIADVFQDLNFSQLAKSQAVYLPRLSLYLLGVPRRGSANMNRLLAYSVVSKRWMTNWDIGTFYAMALGPRRSDEADTVYVTRTGGQLCVLDFSGWSDDSIQWSGVGAPTTTAIATKIEPGDLFTSVEDPNLRFAKKKINRLVFYLTPPGEELESTIYYSWDAGEERSVQLNLNPLKDKPVVLGGNLTGNALASSRDTAVSGVPIQGSGVTFRFRIEDGNGGPLPYLHVDAEVEVIGHTYAQNPRSN